jgi:putative membrane protein
MRWFYLIITVLFAASIIIFAIQNLEMTTMSFLGFSVRAPLAVLAVIMYVIGAATGGSLFALLRKSIQATRAGWQKPPSKSLVGITNWQDAKASYQAC